jgi:hypothetical protein
MGPASTTSERIKVIELAILAKNLLHEAWLCSMQVLEQLSSERLISAERKAKLQELHTVFFYQAFYSPLHTTTDMRELLTNCRGMLAMLKDLDVTAWSNFMMKQGLSN